MIFLRKVVGVSMLPTFKPGSLVVCHKIYKNLRKNDVVVAAVNGREVIKRIEYITKDKKIYLKSDNPLGLSGADWGLLTTKSILGKVIISV